MANEFKKVKDRNNVIHPVYDEAVHELLPSSATSSNKLSTASDIQDVYEVMGENGEKNRLGFTIADIKSALSQASVTATWNGNVCTIADVDYTITTDSSGYVTEIDANGTASADAQLFLKYFTNTYNGMIMNGCPTGGSGGAKYELRFTDVTNYTSNIDSGSGVTINKDNGHNSRILFTVKSGITVDHIKVKPMIRLASDTDPTYQPYAMSNGELTDDRVYKAGDSVTLNTALYTGFVYSGATTILFDVQLPKPVEGTAVTIDKGTGTVDVRGVGGYVLNSESVSNLKIETVSSSLTGRNHGQIKLALRKSDNSAFTATENTPVSILANTAITLTFA